MTLLAAITLGALLAQTPQITPIQSTSITETERSTFQELGLTEQEWRQYKTELTGPRANWSEDRDPLLVLGITAKTPEAQARFAELYVEAELKRNAAILAFSRATSNVWAKKYPRAALFQADGAGLVAPVSGIGPTDRVILVIDPKVECTACVQAISKIQLLGRKNGMTGLDLYFVGVEFPDIATYANARLILPSDVSSKRITLNKATPELMTQLGLTPAKVPAAFRRSPSGISSLSLGDLMSMQVVGF
jgi:integrating conjugative element protein (TIGR03759 family)